MLRLRFIIRNTYEIIKLSYYYINYKMNKNFEQNFDIKRERGISIFKQRIHFIIIY